MKPKDLATGLMREVVNENVAAYRELFTHTPLSDATDPYWQRALAFFASLSEQQRAVFFEVVRQVSVDTVSNVLGVLDGVNAIEGADAGFAVFYGRDQRLDGDLQSLFLVEDEESTKAR
ncbi:hypothetical protein [Aquidulcibacter sp.]|uniref:hypothetical protein n=1 Tax=Aquidulcibacter sp. TaxID=2052990 RepID=UPI0037C13D49